MQEAALLTTQSARDALRRMKIESDDDAIVLAMQTDLVSRCMVRLLKPAIVSCVNARRKYISASDVAFALRHVRWPVADAHEPPLLGARPFERACAAHVRLLLHCLSVGGIDAGDVRATKEMMGALRALTERMMRGFLEVMGREAARQRVPLVRAFDACMNCLLGPSVENALFAPHVP